MSSSSSARPASHTERRGANENGTARPRAPSGQQGVRGERPEPRRPQSPQHSTSGAAHRRNVSSSQKTKGGIEERRTERVQVTTRETLTSRTRSPERRAGPSMQPQERTRPAEVSRANSGDSRAKSSKIEAPQGRAILRHIKSI
jgi:gamma-tubulin complex component 2